MLVKDKMSSSKKGALGKRKKKLLQGKKERQAIFPISFILLTNRTLRLVRRKVLHWILESLVKKMKI